MPQPAYVKFIEARDRATHMSLMAIRLHPRGDSRPNRIVRRAGFGPDHPLVYLVDLTSTHRGTYDPYGWNGSITLRPIHQYLVENWDDVEDGSVLDAEFLRGERDAPRETEL